MESDHDFTNAEADLWKVAYLIANSTGERGAVKLKEETRQDHNEILTWAKTKKVVKFENGKLVL